MNKQTFIEGVKENWHLIVVCLAFFATASVLALGTSQKSMAPKVSAVSKSRSTVSVESGRPYTNKWVEATAETKVDDAIKEYEDQLANDRDGEESAANMYRLANLYYAKRQNYAQAALYYEALLREFPDFYGINTVFPSLAACYERQGELGSEINTYRRMLEYFPEDTQDHQWAKSKLNM